MYLTLVALELTLSFTVLLPSLVSSWPATGAAQDEEGGDDAEAAKEEAEQEALPVRALAMIGDPAAEKAEQDPGDEDPRPIAL